jgi:hypothetical protein
MIQSKNSVIMKKILFLYLLIFSFGLMHAQTGKGKRIYLNKGADNGVMFVNAPNCNPGDTLVVRSSLNPWSYIYLEGARGTADKPIVVINEGLVELTTGLDLNHCRFVKLTGSGTKDKYGFKVHHSGGVAMAIHGRCADIEVERFSVSDCAFGVWIKNEASCDTSINNWVLNNISVHDYEIRNVKIEGFYMGSTDPNNSSRPINCNGEQKFYRPSKLGNIKVYNGFIDGTGRPAIMLCNAQYGMSEIYNNIISNVGREFNDQQGTGISIGMYTRVYVHHNTIKKTYTWGIGSLGGSGLVRIENNKVDSSGYLDGKTLPWPQNIMIDTRATNPVDSTRFIVMNNQVAHPGKDAKSIQIWHSFPTYFSSGNIICNNTTKGKAASVGVTEGIKWSSCKNSKAIVPATSKTNWIIIAGSVFAVVVLVVFIIVYRRQKLLRTIRQQVIVV